METLRWILVFTVLTFAGCATVGARPPVAEDETTKDVIEAVEAVKKTFEEPSVKYCPLTGKRYSPTMTTCPIHGVELKDVSDPR